MRIAVAATLLISGLLSASATLAQSLPIPGSNIPQNLPQKGPPVKKFNGVCYPPESQLYKKLTQGFVPFVAMVDCLKSGGEAAKR